jgi:hypothetical protein
MLLPLFATASYLLLTEVLPIPKSAFVPIVYGADVVYILKVSRSETLSYAGNAADPRKRSGY